MFWTFALSVNKDCQLNPATKKQMDVAYNGCGSFNNFLKKVAKIIFPRNSYFITNKNVLSLELQSQRRMSCELSTVFSTLLHNTSALGMECYKSIHRNQPRPLDLFLIGIGKIEKCRPLVKEVTQTKTCLAGNTDTPFKSMYNLNWNWEAPTRRIHWRSNIGNIATLLAPSGWSILKTHKILPWKLETVSNQRKMLHNSRSPGSQILVVTHLPRSVYTIYSDVTVSPMLCRKEIF